MIPMPPPIPPPLPPSLQTIGDKQERKNEATEVNLMEAIVIASSYSLNSFTRVVELCIDVDILGLLDCVESGLVLRLQQAAGHTQLVQRADAQVLCRLVQCRRRLRLREQPPEDLARTRKHEHARCSPQFREFLPQ